MSENQISSNLRYIERLSENPFWQTESSPDIHSF